MKWLSTHIMPANCERMVAVAAPRIPQPVSYTHLSLLLVLTVCSAFSLKGSKSVYIVGVSASFTDSLVYFTEIQLLDSVRPVSYTHLDVYKRQVCYSGLYGLHRKTIEDNRNKDLSCMEKKAYVCC